MAEENCQLIISSKELLEETTRFKNWSGPYLVKVFQGVKTLTSLGSGGLLKYKGRYFAITNEHVVRSVEKNQRISDINISYKDKDQVDFRATIIAESEDKDYDLAAFEISPHSVARMQNHLFLEETLIEKDVKGYFENRSNVVFLHGYPATDTIIDNQNKVVDMATLPYTTVIESYDVTSDIVMLYAERENGISELGTSISVSTFGGMSGSLIYGYYKDELIPYKCLGIITFWEYKKDRLGVFPIQDVTNFLDREFFDK
ncbi:hypothetical protein ASG65_26180 [Bacillus sp. Leaf13]|nr:hypothetical protein ASG65_26180 [Bacillus sp. Leaf13]